MLLSFEAQAQLTVSTLATIGAMEPFNVAVDTNDNIYITDSVNDRIVKLDGRNNLVQSVLVGTAGTGYSDGPDYAAQFSNPQGMLHVTVGGTEGLLVADTDNHLIRFVRLSDGYVTTLAGQAGVVGATDSVIGASATFAYPYGLAQDTNDNVYICDLLTSKIRVMNLNDPNFGVASVIIAGTTLHKPQAMAFMGTNQLWIADTENHTIKLITLSSATNGSLTSLMGSDDPRTPGTANSTYGPNARFNKPAGLLWISGLGLLISDTGNHSIRLATNNPTYGPTNYKVTTFAGTPGTSGLANGSLLAASFNTPMGLCLDPAHGAFLVADMKNNSIRRIMTGLPPPPPPAPVILTVTTSYGLVSLTWSTLSTATNYHVKRSGGSGTEILIASTTGTNYTDTDVLNGSTYFYVVSASNAGGEGPNSEEVTATVPLPPVPDPQIGYVDFPATANPQYSSVFHPISSFVFNNDAPPYIVIVGVVGSQTYYNLGNTITNNFPTNGIPNPTSASASAPSGYQDGLYPSEVANLAINQVLPDMTIRAIGEKNDGSPNSAIVQARFQFITANPVISGGNAAGFTVSDITTGAHLYYTIDGSTPSETNYAANGDMGVLTGTNTFWSVGFSVQSNTLFKVRAFRNNYQPSGIVSNLFTTAGFQPNTITFGKASGEPHSSFLARPGQFFYAPVTLQLIAGFGKMYSLQFNAAVTNGYTNLFSGAATIPPVVNGAGIDFFSMLMTTVPPEEGKYYPPADGNWYLPIPPVTIASAQGTTNYAATTFVNTNNNLLGVGYFYRTGFKYKFADTNGIVFLDFDTTKQDLITYSIAHDTLFTKGNGVVVVGAYSFQVPTNATNGDQYFIQLGSPSATADGVGAPGSSIYIQPPPLSQAVTVDSPAYLVGDAAPFRWLNAGDFGNTNLDSADVMQVYQAAITSVDMPPLNSDLFYAMDSCGNVGVTNTGSGYYTNTAAYPYPQAYTITNTTYTYDTNGILVDTTQDVVNLITYVYNTTASFTATYTDYEIFLATPPASPITNFFTQSYTINVTPPPPVSDFFNGSDSYINQIAFGDGILDVNDLYVTFRRSLDPSLIWFKRFWTNSQFVAVTTPNLAFNTNTPNKAAASLSKDSLTPAVNSGATPDYTKSTVTFSAGDAVVTASQTIQIPISAQIFGDYPLRVLGLNLTVVPLDGSPAITMPVTFTPVAGLGSPTITSSKGAANYSAAWLNSGIGGLSGNTQIGTLTVTVPATATSLSAYAVHFNHASASPNGLALFPKQTLTGLITLSSRTNSSYGDGIPDSWRLRWFGTVNNLLSTSNNCPSGDGISNWMKYVAGIDPNTPNNFPSVHAKTPAPAGAATIHWPTVSGKQYVIERSTSLFPGSWTTIATNPGTGTDMEFNDTNNGAVKFYRVRILP